MKRSIRYRAFILFACGQTCFVIGMATCIAIRPQGLRVNSGISFYGVFEDTLPFYLLGLLGPALFSLLAARLITLPELKLFRYCLTAFGLLVIVVAATPFILSLPVYLLHTGAGIAAFAAQLILSIWIVVKLRWAGWPLFLCTLELFIGLLSLWYIFQIQGFLTQSSIGFQLVYAVLLLHGFRKLLPERDMAEL